MKVCEEDGREIVIHRTGKIDLSDEIKGAYKYSVSVGIGESQVHICV